MTIRKTKILDLKSLTGVTTVGIFTAGTTTTDAGTAGTSYVKGLIAHNTGSDSCGFSMYILKDQISVAPGTSEANQTNRILRVDLAANETFFFETPYPITLTPNDAIAVDIRVASSGGSGIGSVVNVQLLGDVDI
jgi:hypothetical protein